MSRPCPGHVPAMSRPCPGQGTGTACSSRYLAKQLHIMLSERSSSSARLLSNCSANILHSYGLAHNLLMVACSMGARSSSSSSAASPSSSPTSGCASRCAAATLISYSYTSRACSSSPLSPSNCCCTSARICTYAGWRVTLGAEAASTCASAWRQLRNSPSRCSTRASAFCAAGGMSYSAVSSCSSSSSSCSSASSSGSSGAKLETPRRRAIAAMSFTSA
mmetsp:Transcript_28192/g.65874  ORF Transcript_28192/g.65874 Transcript_28192/m.65874 type:complete len:220 (-) Transcript_28192:1519-2178(-)